MEKRFLTLEDYYRHNGSEVVDFLGPTDAQFAWALKDLDLSSEYSDEICSHLDSAIARLVGDRRAEWVVETEESHALLDLGQVIEYSLGRAVLLERDKTGISDIDFNFEQQLDCGQQLEDLMSGDWFKARLSGLYDPENFESSDDTVTMDRRFPVADMMRVLDSAMETATDGGMRHPYLATLAVGGLSLRIFGENGEDDRMITIGRRSGTSDIRGLLTRLGDELNIRAKALSETIAGFQQTLAYVPEGWPNEHASKIIAEWCEKRFAGDNGLDGCDLYSGEWLKTGLPDDVHVRQHQRHEQSSDAKEREDVAAHILPRKKNKI